MPPVCSVRGARWAALRDRRRTLAKSCPHGAAVLTSSTRRFITFDPNPVFSFGPTKMPDENARGILQGRRQSDDRPPRAHLWPLVPTCGQGGKRLLNMGGGRWGLFAIDRPAEGVRCAFTCRGMRPYAASPDLYSDTVTAVLMPKNATAPSWCKWPRSSSAMALPSLWCLPPNAPGGGEPSPRCPDLPPAPHLQTGCRGDSRKEPLASAGAGRCR